MKVQLKSKKSQTTRSTPHDNDNDIDEEKVEPRMVSIGSLLRRQTAAGRKITRTTKKRQKYQQAKGTRISTTKKGQKYKQAKIDKRPTSKMRQKYQQAKGTKMPTSKREKNTNKKKKLNTNKQRG